ncbi:MAG TPA: PBP1A family penicillin-binding protein [Vicinamibacterales bacterium]|nr:PBP1A family penicillin-binding protein [Vicinamibacterales bacterium]
MPGTRIPALSALASGWMRAVRSMSPRVRAAVALLGALAGGYAAWFAYDVATSVPDRVGIRALRVMAQATVLFDAGDRPVFTLAKEHRIEVPLSDLSPDLIRAVVAIEDRRFFEHEGFDPRRILGSAVAVLRAGSAVQGGSTITQQLARQSLGREKTLRRKAKELLIAIELERHYTKQEILELYLNRVYFGDGLYGAEAAARGFFGRRASELTLAEAALLAGLLQAPSAYAPTVNLEKAEARRNVVLQAMLDTGAIATAEYEAARAARIELRDGLHRHEPHGLYFKEEVRRQLVQQFGWERVSEGGLRVYTTIDLAKQRAADAAVGQSLREIERTLARRTPGRGGAAYAGADSTDVLQAALVALDPGTGAVRAMVGGRDFEQSPYNRAMQARRQPGSAFKPFVYAAALEAGYRPDDEIDRLDEPLQLANATWTPDDVHSSEPVLTLREALRVSSNRAAVRLLDDIGLPATLQTARAFGFEGLPSVPSLALGSGEVTLDAITAAFGAFASGGLVRRPVLVRRVLDRDGTVLFEAAEPARRAITAETAYRMAGMLADVVDAGTASAARRLGFMLPAAGKTGTTNEYRDAWFIGFTPALVTGVWVGYDQPRTIRGHGYASDLAVPLWTRFMKAATRGTAPRWLTPPPGLENDEGVRGNVVAEAAEGGQKKRGFWGRLFGFGRRR